MQIRLAALALALSALVTTNAGAQSFVRASVDSLGLEGNSTSLDCDVSGDGRFVAFTSSASNLVALDTNGVTDIFHQGHWVGTIQRVGYGPAGAEPDNHSYFPAVSDDGRFVAFQSDATNLVPGDTNAKSDVFVYGPVPRNPAPDIDVNGQDGPLTVPAGTPISVSVALDAGDAFGQPFDWWAWAGTPFGEVWLRANLSWVQSSSPLRLLQAGLLSFGSVPVLPPSVLPSGKYCLHFVLDALNGNLEGTFEDVVELTIQ